MEKAARRPVVAGNWKMHGDLEGSVALAREISTSVPSDVETVIFPPYVFLMPVIAVLEGAAVGVGAQDIHCETEGAFTGAVSAAMVRSVGASHVIVGHSERRSLFADTDEMVARKFELALAAELTPILCVGETLAQRERGDARAVVLAQLERVLAQVGAHGLERGMIAYEPVWAIGTGRTATPAQAQEMHAIIREAVARHDAEAAGAIRILYGGSVKADNARSLLDEADIDGALVGGASLKADTFTEIVRAASREET